MDREGPVPLWAVLAIGVVVLTAIYLLGQPSPGRQRVTPALSSMVSPAQPTTSAASPAALRVGNIYANNYYGYSFLIPDGWRLATDFMTAWNANMELPGIDSVNAEYVVLTATSADAEASFVWGQFSHESRGEYGFAPGQTVFIDPSPSSIEHSYALL